jgi:hypothetical protein
MDDQRTEIFTQSIYKDVSHGSETDYFYVLYVAMDWKKTRRSSKTYCLFKSRVWRKQ